jgi:hypothetical protein
MLQFKGAVGGHSAALDVLAWYEPDDHREIGLRK